MERSWKRIISPVDDSDSSWSTEDSEFRCPSAAWKRHIMSLKRIRKANEDGQGTSSSRAQVFAAPIASISHPNPTDVLMHHDYVGSASTSNMTVTPIPMPYEDPNQLRNYEGTGTSRTNPHRIRKTISYYRNRSLTMYSHNVDPIISRHRVSSNGNRVNDAMAISCPPQVLGEFDWSTLAGPSQFSMNPRPHQNQEDLSSFINNTVHNMYGDMRPLEPPMPTNDVTYITPLTVAIPRTPPAMYNDIPMILPAPIEVSDFENNQNLDPLSEDSIVDLTPESRDDIDVSITSKSVNIPSDQAESKPEDTSKLDENANNASESLNAAPENTPPKAELSKQEEQENLNEVLLSLLECPVCLEVMAPPVHQCRRGHLLCALCRSRLSTCPTCRTSFTSCRNLAMEKVAEKLKYPCKNNASGCSVHVILREKREHEANCPHRLYNCLSAFCAPNWSCKLSTLLPHYENLHPNMILRGPTQLLNLTYEFYRKPASLDWIIFAFGELFRLNVQLIPSGELYGCVQYIGPKNVSRKYIYELKTEITHDTFRRVIFERTTHNDQIKVEKNYDINDAFFLSVNWTKQFISEHRNPRSLRKLEISVTLRPA